MTVIASWALKRSVIGRLRNLASGALTPYAGTDILAEGHPEFGGPVQIAYYLPAAPDRLCVYGTSMRAGRQPITGEGSGLYATGQAFGMSVETVSLELRVRCHSPGDDVEAVDAVSSRLCQAVASAVLDGPALFQQGTMILQTINQDPTILAPQPEPSVITNVSLLFTAGVVVP